MSTMRISFLLLVGALLVPASGKAQAPASVQQVRQRVAAIGSDGAARQVVYPVIIMAGGGQGEQAAPHQRDEALRRQLDEISDRLYDLESAVRDEAVRYRDGRTDDRTARTRVPEETVITVERALLGTGVFRVSEVIFEFDKSTLLPTAENTLDAVAEVMEDNPELHIQISGHTDSIGTEAYNQQLSEARAQAVYDYLTGSFGIDAERLATRGFGESRPLIANTNPTRRALNRRVEFEVIER